MKKKSILILFSILLTITLLIGCGQTGTNPTEPSDDVGRSTWTEEPSGENNSVPDSYDPGNLEQPGNSQKPDNTERPGSNQKPSNSEQPGDSQKPDNSEQPGNSQKPDNTEQPGNSQKPDNSEQPGSSQKPDNTERPGNSQKPDNSEQPGSSQKPDNSEKPSTPSTPTEPNEPEVSKLPYEKLDFPKIPDTSKLKTAEEVVKAITNSKMSEFEKVFAIHNWLTFHIDYDFTYSHYYAAETIRDRKGVCQGYAYAFREMCTLVGLETTIVGGEGINPNGQKESHAWNQVKIDGTWYNVDVTWDDPASSANKDPNDHSGNRYDYFLVSNQTLYADHAAKELVEGSAIQNCSKDYSRKTVLKKAAESGWHNEMGYASSDDELEDVILKFMKADKTEVWIWYYNTDLNKKNFVEEIKKELTALDYPARLRSYYLPVNGVAKIKVEICSATNWNSYEVVTNVNEFKALLDKNGDSGKKTYTIRYESSSGKPECAGSKYGFSYSYIEYEEGKSWIMTITIK